jgi:hypothetical protein
MAKKKASEKRPRSAGKPNAPAKSAVKRKPSAAPKMKPMPGMKHS